MNYLTFILPLDFFYLLLVFEIMMVGRSMKTKTVFLNSPWVGVIRRTLALLTSWYIMIFLIWAYHQKYPLPEPEHYLFLGLVIVFNIVEIIILVENKRVKAVLYLATPLFNTVIYLLLEKTSILLAH